ncbi:hypothetical protein GCM10027430_30770 [Lysobacter tyrosinilyticus]
MSRNALRAACCAVIASALLIAPAAYAECSASSIERMASRGKTVAAIARLCEMNKQDVQDVLESGEADPGTDSRPDEGGGAMSRGALRRGTPVGECGCWGPVDPSLRQPHPRCKSGYAQPRSCGIPCQMGGMAWQGVCI